MIRQQKLRKNKLSQSYTSPYINKNSAQSQSVNLKTIIQDIKYLQTCVTTLECNSISLQRKKSCQTPKKSNLSSNSKSNKKRSTSLNKQSNKKDLGHFTKSSKDIDVEKMDNQKYNQHLQKIQETQAEICKKQNPCQIFVLLQMQNLKLQKQNLSLQNKLLDQQLQVQRRQKQILKNRLKKIKINLLSCKDIDLPKIPNKHQKTQKKPQMNTFYDRNRSNLINVFIPQFKTEQDTLKMNEQNEIDKLQYSSSILVSRKSLKQNNKYEQDHESLLISKNESFTKHNFKENQQLLQNQFWKLLGQSEKVQSSRKWEVRQAMGNIANKLKTIRKR